GNTGDDVAHRHFGTILMADQSVGRQQVLSRGIRAWQHHIVTSSIDQFYHRTDIFTRGRTVFRIDYFNVGQTSQLVSLTVDGNTFFHTHEFDTAFHFRHDRVGVRIPAGHFLTGFNLGTILHADDRTVRQLVQLALTTVLIGNGNGTGTGYRDQIAVITGHGLHVLQTHGTVVLHLHAVGSRSTRSCTTDVERTHGQLCTRLTNGLSSDNTHGLTHVHLVTATEVTTVTGRTDTDTAFTGNGRAHQNFVDAFGFDLGHPGFVDQSTGRYHDIAFRTRLVYIGCHHTTQNTVTKGYHHVTAFDQRSHDQTFFRAAIVLGHYQILCHVNQTTGQVTGVRSLQSGIRQTLTRTVGGGEVLQYVQTFTEVRGNRRLNNRTVRLGHQTTHTRQLTDLGR